jgi:hypothetical protein
MKGSPENLSPEEQNLQEQEERYQHYMETHPDVEIPPGSLKESGPEIDEFEKLIAAFEDNNSLEELHQIINLTPQEAPFNVARERAKAALGPIVEKLNSIKRETDISKSRHDELKAEYMRLSRAVGIINNNRVDHNR